MSLAMDIRPCPFCGSFGVALVGSFVRCGSCGAAGPYGLTDAEAIQRWNERVRAEPQGEHVANASRAGKTKPPNP